jgi:hypothetical protein
MVATASAAVAQRPDASSQPASSVADLAREY